MNWANRGSSSGISIEESKAIDTVVPVLGFGEGACGVGVSAGVEASLFDVCARQIRIYQAVIHVVLLTSCFLAFFAARLRWFLLSLGGLTTVPGIVRVTVGERFDSSLL